MEIYLFSTKNNHDINLQFTIGTMDMEIYLFSTKNNHETPKGSELYHY